METNRSIRASILPGMWTTSLDLSDVYFHIPICHSYRRYLRFVWDNRVYQFRALLFGLSTAPLVFTKVMQAAIAHLHSQAIQIHSYMDDSLIKELSPEKLYLNTRCSEKEVDPFQIPVQQLADFLIFLFEEKGLSPSTIKGYCSAISRTIYSGGPDFGSDEFISLLVTNFSLERPRQRVFNSILEFRVWICLLKPFPLGSAKLFN